jgi:hypothetical protein
MTRNTADRLWLAGASLLAALSIAVLWPLRETSQPCPAIYPVPDWCAGTTTNTGVLVSIGLTLALLSAIFVTYFTAAKPRLPIVILTAAIATVSIICLLLVAVQPIYGGPILID